jgi:hypothetical protein
MSNSSDPIDTVFLLILVYIVAALAFCGVMFVVMFPLNWLFATFNIPFMLKPPIGIGISVWVFYVVLRTWNKKAPARLKLWD